MPWMTAVVFEVRSARNLGAPRPGSPRTGLRSWDGYLDFQTWKAQLSTVTGEPKRPLTATLQTDRSPIPSRHSPC
jgi:hypothetical protein